MKRKLEERRHLGQRVEVRRGKRTLYIVALGGCRGIRNHLHIRGTTQTRHVERGCEAARTATHSARYEISNFLPARGRAKRSAQKVEEDLQEE
jgi:hypothetical protein